MEDSVMRSSDRPQDKNSTFLDIFEINYVSACIFL